jgi:glycosyltransferase involved in cell wall biosynthesis
MKKRIIGFPIAEFCGWMGGANLALGMTNSVNLACQSIYTEISPILMYDVTGKDFSIPPNGYLRSKKSELHGYGVTKEFLSLSNYDEIYLYKDFQMACKAISVDVVGPSPKNLGEKFEIPWAAWIPDFQHRHFPNFFSQDEINDRNIKYANLLCNAPLVFVNSQSVIDDIRKLYTSSEIRTTVKRLPLIQLPIDNAKSVDYVRTELNISKEYFIVCCQQWKHKSHDIIIRAFASFLNYEKIDCDLVITGEQTDYRHPELRGEIDQIISELNLDKHVKYLGLVERDHQLTLIAGAKALIQASVIEGGPGASGVAEAASLDVPIIASNIDANLEMSFGRHTFFKVGSVESLAEAMSSSYSKLIPQRFPITKNEVDAINLSCGVQMIRMLL